MKPTFLGLELEANRAKAVMEGCVMCLGTQRKEMAWQDEEKRKKKKRKESELVKMDIHLESSFEESYPVRE